MSAIRKTTTEVTVNTVLDTPQYNKVKTVQKKFKLKTQGQAVAKLIDLVNLKTI